MLCYIDMPFQAHGGAFTKECDKPATLVLAAPAPLRWLRVR
jgi:hypothetical protein